MKYPERTPVVEFTCSRLTLPVPALRGDPNVTALVRRPSIVTIIGVFEAVSTPAVNVQPVPLTLTVVPLGPEVGDKVSVWVAALAGKTSSGRASEKSSNTVIIVALVFLFLNGILWIIILSIFLFSPF